MILHLIENLFPESGGPPTVVIEFARHQALSGRKVAVVCNRGPSRPEQHDALMQTWRGAPIHYVDISRLPLDQRRGALERSIDEIDPKVMHIHCMWEGFVRHASASARRRGTPYVLSTHGMLHPFVLAQKRLKKWAYLTLFPQIIGGAAEVFALNGQEADHISSRFHVKSSVLPNGIDSSEYAGATPDLFLEKQPQLKGRSFILFVGRIHPIKGIDQLVRSFAIARSRGIDFDLVVIGPENGGGAQVRAAIEQCGVQSHVHLLGGKFGAEKLSAFAAASIVAHRPRFEGFGIAVVEGLATGRPVVTTAECRLDGAEEAGALVIAPDTDEGFAAALMQVASHRELARHLGDTGQRWAREFLNWERLARRADEAYGAAMARS
jgi:glycosyltransferase involved in cell wall biosynthesis